MRFVALAALLIASGCASKGTGEGQIAPDFKMATLENDLVSFAEKTKGKVVLLDFWATWCGPCRQTMPVYERLHRTYREQGLEVVALSSDNSPKLVKDYFQRMQLTMPVYMDAGGVANVAYQVSGLPTTLVIDRDGKIVLREEGVSADSAAKIEAAIKANL